MVTLEGTAVRIGISAQCRGGEGGDHREGVLVSGFPVVLSSIKVSYTNVLIYLTVSVEKLKLLIMILIIHQLLSFLNFESREIFAIINH